MSDSAPTTSERGIAARQRRMTTRTSVKLGENIAQGVITVGGLMVIVAVMGIMVFLFRVVMPLMAGGELQGNTRYQLDTQQDVIWINGDEFQTLGIAVAAEGRVITYHIPSGTEVARDQFDFRGAEVTAVAGTLQRDRVAFGFDDGVVRFATLGVQTTTTAQRALPGGLIDLDGRDRMLDGRVYTEVGTGDFRTLFGEIELGDGQQISELPIIAIDYRIGGTRERPTIAFATVDADNQVRVSQSRVQINMMTGAETVSTTTTDLPPLVGLAADAMVTGILLSGTGDRAIVASDDGVVYRYDLRDMDNPSLAEVRRVADDGVAVTAMTFLSGEETLVVGTEDGGLNAFFRLQTGTTDTTDGRELMRARTHAPMPASIVDLSEAQRQKEFVAIDAEGNVWVYHSTSDQVLFELARSGDVSTDSSGMIFPRSNGVMLVSQGGEVEAWQYTQRHPEVTLGVLFSKIWYEGYMEPTYVWQSTAGTDLAEPKYSLVPLVFGTFKAAFYAMIFAVPIALMAAIYTSEFVDKRVRGTVKPMMEMMESLPTVVLGFIAALVLAPLVEEWIGAVLLGFFALPMGLMIGAFAWQALPAQIALKYDGFPKFTLMGLSILITAWVAAQLGTSLERVLFYGDFKQWTTGRIGTGTPFMFLILLPVSYFVTAWAFRKQFGHHYRDLISGLGRSRAGMVDAGRWIVLLLVAMLLSFLVAYALTLIGYDPRGSFIDSYQQRNALVVGFIMAFAVIPNIYTLAEDALNSVPGHLRAASLACGATPWQTARWVILPTAASGVFSAVMMGMGRAVGETMIVVMAAGNTPIMEWNIFSGLRTLSANIAIELPEAVKDGTNYRVLFLAALTLFIMTFVINTGAELIRQRFRKRAFNL
ncbi:ABC transporter permease subunit [Roseinatronobacter sp. S2]|uniref:ABC transporter permease subunit n=1 Tax=Roseinatronobacter sp. S2 TaxID=3035471 RepID=UPI00240EA8EF|nr:ABC transporter permease subunit [Roseinatronobacter sp. S2]WFE74954.1 ABC transporter permease subunit [Roseinatronobacter sp. S2]